MARGHPDYLKSVGYTKEGVFLEEYALPPIWWQDDFDEPICKWNAVAGILTIMTNVLFVTRFIYPLSGPNFLHCTTPLGGNFTATQTIGSFPLTTHIGFQVSFCLRDKDDFVNAANSFTPIYFDVQTETARFFGRITYNPRNGNWYYLAADGVTYVPIGTHEVIDEVWHYAKLLINPITHAYLSFQINNNIFSLAGVNYSYTAGVAAAYCVVAFLGSSDAGDQIEVLFEDYKLTYGES